MTTELAPVGALLEAARKRLGLSARAAAKKAGISEGRWRQIVTGVQKAGAVLVPVNPKPSTVAQMADAVGVPRSEALMAAGMRDSSEYASLVGVSDQPWPRPSEGEWDDMEERREIGNELSDAVAVMAGAVDRLAAIAQRIKGESE